MMFYWRDFQRFGDGGVCAAGGENGGAAGGEWRLNGAYAPVAVFVGGVVYWYG